MKRIIVLMLVLGSCGGVPEQVDKKRGPSAQTKSLGGSVDKGAKDVSKTTIFETPVEGKKDISKLVEKEDKIKPATFEEVNLNLLVRNIKGKKLLEIKNKLGGPKRIRIEPQGKYGSIGFPNVGPCFFIKYSDGGKTYNTRRFAEKR